MQSNTFSHGLWEKTAPPAPRTGRLAGEKHVDVAVVGAGFTGLSAALDLARSGVSVAVLEGAGVGFGGSGRNVGLVNAGLWIMPDEVSAILGEEYGQRLLKTLADGPALVFDLIRENGIDCEAEHAGTLHCAADRKGLRELEERARQWQARGAPVRLLGGDETAARVGTIAYLGSLLDERAGTIQPLGYVRGLANAALRAGAEIFTASPVSGTEREGHGWRVRTTEGSVRAEWVIVATNAYTTAPWPQVRAELVHLPYFNFATSPLSESALKRILPGLEGAWDTKTILSSLRRDRQGRLIFGSVGALRGPGAAVHSAWARRSLRKLFPFLDDVAFESSWYGKIGMTADATPRFHRFDRNVVGFSGYNGRGIAPGTVFGQYLARLIRGEISERDIPLPVTDPREQSFRSLREAFYETGAQLAHFVGARV
ncbi:FAD-binding oxidoreductase [Mesorhizobium waimense]|uniref:FAD-binding oxidoreductase n=1 Tax=Mesorhizobium waimense TaxID=1300307 RepID=A0A3A5LAP5_9HYPH|nr:FAD-binding oxidoreductase [Mesorhizobium waimense]RJT41359.1 FAD-binding oxidoreductase [Mesorhizobium waimense]